VNDILQFVLKHGYAFLFAGIFAHQVGIPIPGPLILVCAGALAAGGKLGVLPVLGITVVACVLADWIWFEAGRRRGDKILHFLHRLTTRDPEFHDRRAKRIFARYGPALLLVAKFVPGLDAVAPPLAAIARTSRVRFLTLDAVGSGLYACAYGGLGYVFRHDLNRAAEYVSRTGKLFVGLVVAAVCIYIIHKAFQRHRLFRESQVVRIAPVDPADCGDAGAMPCGILGGQENGD
jgi:membrane protein DedA with SNARE-associated domain